MSDDNENERRVIGEFLDELRDTASGLQVLIGNLRSRSVPVAEGLAQLKRDSSNLRSQAQALGLPLVKLVTHRLEEYVGELHDLGTAEIDEIEIFVTKIEHLADGDSAQEVDVPSVVRSLPHKRNADVDFGKIEKKNVEILLAVPEKAMSRIVERELANCGYRTSVVRDAFEAIETVVRTRPDMVIASMELGVLSGVDLGCALAAMPATEGVAYALFTSYEWGNPKLKSLPARAAIIRKGAQFSSDLAECLSRFEVM